MAEINFTKDYVFTFGKYKGKTVKQVCEQCNHPSYMLWLIKKDPQRFGFADDEVEKYVLKKIKHLQALRFEALRTSGLDYYDLCD